MYTKKLTATILTLSFLILMVVSLPSYADNGITTWGSIKAGGKVKAAPAAGTEHEVYPTGVAATDVANLQTAIDGANPGDTILLKATDSNGNPQNFNLTGFSYGWGDITKSVSIKGEVDVQENPATKVFCNGNACFFYGYVAAVENISVSNIEFSGDCSYSFIGFQWGVDGTTVVENIKTTDDSLCGGVIRAYDIKGNFIARNCDLIGTFADAIVLTHTTGDVTVENNTINHENYYPGAPEYNWLASIHIHCVEGTTRIANNNVTAKAPSGVIASICIEVALLPIFPVQMGPVYIEDNVCHCESAEDLEYRYGAIHIDLCEAVVSKNIIATKNVLGIALWNHNDKGCSVFQNDINVIDHAYTGINVWRSSDNVIKANNLKGGTVTYAFIVDGDSLNNILLGNNVNGVTIEDTTIYLGEETSGNTLRGYSGGSVVDFGTDNFITGYEPMAGAGGLHLGQEMNDNDTGRHQEPRTE